MFSIGQKLFGMVSRNLPADTLPPAPTFGRSLPASEMVSAVAEDDDSKWKLTNIGGIGSDEDKELREKAAESEVEFEGAGQQPGIEIWRVEKFTPNKVEDVRAENLQLYSGDCYIVLKTTKRDDSDALDWKLHYWIGKNSTQDESGSAAYFTVNLDDLLDQKPVQHREMQYSESALFHTYFKSVTYLDGGIDSGFRKAEPETYTPRLLRMAKVSGTVRVVQVPLAASSLNDGDVFILDNGMELYQVNAENSNVFERSRAMEIVQQDLIAERDHEPELVILDGEEIFTCEPFWEILGGKIDELPSAEDDETRCAFEQSSGVDSVDFSSVKTLAKVSDEDGTGELIVSVVKKDANELVADEDVDDQDVWVIACHGQAFIYVGESASRDEKRYVWNCCDGILVAVGLPEGSPVTFFSKSSDSALWAQLFC